MTMRRSVIGIVAVSLAVVLMLTARPRAEQSELSRLLGAVGEVLGIVATRDLVDNELLVQRAVPASEDVPLAAGAIVPVTGHECPPGWSQVIVDGEPLYFPLGMLVDEDGSPITDEAKLYTGFTLLLACEKQQ